MATTAPTITNGTASKRIPIAAAIGTFCVHSIVDVLSDSIAAGDTLGTDSLNEGFVLDSTGKWMPQLVRDECDDVELSHRSPSLSDSRRAVFGNRVVINFRLHGS